MVGTGWSMKFESARLCRYVNELNSQSTSFHQPLVASFKKNNHPQWVFAHSLWNSSCAIHVSPTFFTSQFFQVLSHLCTLAYLLQLRILTSHKHPALDCSCPETATTFTGPTIYITRHVRSKGANMTPTADSDHDQLLANYIKQLVTSCYIPWLLYGKYWQISNP